MAIPCTQTLLFTAVLLGTSLAGRDHSARTKLNGHTANKAADTSYGPPKCTAGTPQFPNYIQPIPVDPKRLMGKWYYYSDPIPDLGVTINEVTYLTNMVSNNGMTLYPGSNTQAVAFEQLYGVYSLTQNQCNTTVKAYLDYLTVEGKMLGIGFTNGVAAMDTSLVLATDYDNYALFYECDLYDISSGICGAPLPYVTTRNRPDQVSTATANAIASAINQALGQYCFTADMMVPYLWAADKPECPGVPATDACYGSVRDAYKYLADPSFTG